MSVLLKNIIFSSILVLSRDLQWFLMHSSNLISLVDSRRFAFVCFRPHASHWSWDREKKAVTSGGRSAVESPSE